MDNNKNFEERKREVEEFFETAGVKEKLEQLFSDEEIKAEIKTHYESALARMDEVVAEAPEDSREAAESIRGKFGEYTEQHFEDHVKMVFKNNLYGSIQTMKDIMPESITSDERFIELMKTAMCELLNKDVAKQNVLDTVAEMEDDIIDFFYHELIGKLLFDEIPDEVKEFMKALSDSDIGVGIGVLISNPFEDDEDPEDDDK